MKYGDIQKLHDAGLITGEQRQNIIERFQLKEDGGNKFMVPVSIFGALLMAAVLLTGCQTSTFTHKHFQERVARIHSVALMPQVHTALLNTYFGNDPFPAPLPEEPQIRSELITSAIDQLRQRGFVVKEGSFPDGTNQIWNGQMAYGAFSVKPSPATLPDAKALATDQNVDGLIFLYADAFKSTSHRVNITSAQNTLAVFLFLASIAAAHPADVSIPLQGAQAQIAVVDGNTGDVLWTTVDYFNDFETNKPAKTVEDLFGRYPKMKKDTP